MAAGIKASADGLYGTLQVNSADVVTFNDSGNVGIGTLAPLSFAKQTIQFDAGAVAQALALVAYGGSPTISFRQAAGTAASPSASNTTAINLIGATTSDGTTFFNTSAIQSSVEGAVTTGSHPTYIGFSTTPSGSTSRSERMRIDSSGNVGIGTSSPSTYGGKLAVHSAPSTQATVFIQNPGTGSLHLGFSAASSNVKLYNCYSDGLLSSGKGIDIDTGGNVGINGALLAGTPGGAAGKVLSLSATQYPQIISTASSATTGNKNVRFIYRDSGAFQLQTLDDTYGTEVTAYEVLRSTTGITYQAWLTGSPGAVAERMRITSGGQVLIGGTSAGSTQSKLEMQGATSTAMSFYMLKAGQVEMNMGFKASTDTNFYIGTSGSVVGATGVYLNNGGSSWNAVSDERTKTILEPIENAADKVASLRAVIGYYNNDKNQTRRPFLIAQDVQTVLPEAVNIQDPDTGTLGMSYTDMIPLLVAAIKELKAIVDAQAVEIAALKSI